MKFKKSVLLIFAVILCSFVTMGCSAIKNEKEAMAENKYAIEIKNRERFFKSEIIPKLDSEKVILDYFKIEISDDYYEFKNVFIDSEQYNYYPELAKKQFDKGLYTEELTVNSLTTLNEDEYTNDINGLKYYPYMEKLKEYNPSEFEIIDVKYTNKLTDEYDKISQWGSGKWTRYFVVVKEKEDSDWRIFDVYGHM